MTEMSLDFEGRITCHLDFILRGITFDPEEATRALELVPSQSFRAGESYRLRSGAERSRPWSVWHFSSEAAGLGDDLDAHARYLLANLEPKANRISYLRAKADFSTIWIWWESNQNTASFALRTDVVRRLAALADELSFSVIASSDDEA